MKQPFPSPQETTPSFDHLLEQFKQLLRANGLKYTKQREAILQTIYDHHGHFTPEELYRLVQSHFTENKTGVATVYRTLSLLERAGIVTSISFGTQGKRYELGTKAHHDHLICTKCGKILEFFDEAIEKRQETIAKEFGFKMEDHSLKIFGLCPDCQNKEEKNHHTIQ